ncbi:hypothetical protein [Salinigranum sp.]|uniref:hypothetical protein n=1 Tax=Salinigranum sp. TaxID=1966351 RepID=UPI0035695665
MPGRGRLDLETGVQEEVDLVYEGRDVTVEASGGNSLGPCLSCDVTPDTVLARAETFDLLGAMPAADVDESPRH